MEETKFCEYCGNKVHVKAVMCPKCGRQLEELSTGEKNSAPNVVINNIINNGNMKECDKWIALLLCFFFGFIGAHKFYEGKIGLGVLYLLTFGIFGIGWFIDFIVILFRKNPYYV